MRLQKSQWKNALAAAFVLLCLAVSAYYLTAGYGAFLDADMSSELALAQHLAETGRLISGEWRYSTEVRVLNTQLVFTPLMALFGHDWHLVRALGCMILLTLLAASVVFCARSLGAAWRFALLFAGLSVLPFSLIYAQMIVIGAYYVPHAVLTNLLIGLAAGMVRERGRAIRGALLVLLAAVMGASSIRYLLCATLPAAAAGVWLAVFPKGETLTRESREIPIAASSLLAAAASATGYVLGTRVLEKLCSWDGGRYAGSRLMGVTGTNLFELLDQAMDGLIKLCGYMEGKILLSVQGLLSVGALGLMALGVLLLVRAMKDGCSDAPRARFGALALVMSAGLTLFTFLFVEGLYLNRYWLPVMTLGAPVMAMCLTRERNDVLRALSAAAFACVLLGLSAAQMKNSMAHPEIGTAELSNAQAVRESGIGFGYATFWNANVMTELTDGEVEIVAMNLQSDAQGNGYPGWVSWLETEENAAENRPDEPVLLLLEQSEAAQMEAFLALSGAQRRELPAPGLEMYVIDSQRAYFDAAEQMSRGE